jgi:hypothetical protein
MANDFGLNYAGAPDILGAVRTGVGIRQSIDDRALAREKYDANLKQLALENKRADEDRARKEEEHEFDMGLNTMKAGKTTGRIDTMNRGFMRAMQAIGVEVPEDLPIDQETYDELLKISDIKDPIQRDIAEDGFAERFGFTLTEAARQAKTVGADVSAFEESQKAEAEAAKAEQEMKTFKQKETFKSMMKEQEKAAELELKEPEMKNVQTYSGGKGLYERDPKKGTWKLKVPDPKQPGGKGKGADKELRELNLTEKIFKQASREADVEFGKLVPKWEFSDARGRLVENTEYDFEGRKSFINQKIEELRKKAGISDEVVQSLRGGIPSHDPNAPASIPATPAAPGTPAETPPDLPTGYTLGEAETTGKNRGLKRVYDQNGVLKGHYR